MRKDLTPEEREVIENKGTEPAFSGKFSDFAKEGIYVCKRCGSKLFDSSDKFYSGCGWPSFDDEFPNSVKKVPDSDGHRTEILCSNCGGHLGHIFKGEGYTKKNQRYCVNSLSLDFVKEEKEENLKEAYFAAGCFWGVEHLFKSEAGVVSTKVGYMGGQTKSPKYEQVCRGDTGHYETVKVVYDSGKVSYEDLVKLFFEIHDFSQTDGQGPDIGEQYKSVIFYSQSYEKKVALHIINLLERSGFKVETLLLPAGIFYEAEGYHQEYYVKKGSKPYCHFRRKIFE
ncbi:MAG: bifunctional methionine sulfoxide reductase B/A protein [Nanoarchaeota archaeon]